MNTQLKDEDHARQQAAEQYSTLAEMVANLTIDGAADTYAANLTREQCVDLLTGELGIDCRDDEPIEDLREAVAENIKDGSLPDPEGFEWNEDDAQQAIQEDPISIEVRTDWHAVGDPDNKPTHFNILLCTGGPAVRIIGKLNEYGEPNQAWIEYQDWFTPWTEYHSKEVDQDTLLTYCRQFYFGD